MEERETSLKDEIKSLNESINRLAADSSKKLKKTKVRKLSRGDVKKGYVHYFYMKENNDFDAVKVPIEDGVIIHEGIPRAASNEFIFSFRGQPAILQYHDSLFPILPNATASREELQEMKVTGLRAILSKVKEGQLKPKKKISGAMIFGIVIAILVVGYLLLGGAS